MKFGNGMVAALLLNIIATTNIAAPQESSTYRRELKALKGSRFYKTILNHRSNSALRTIIGGVENAKELNLFHRLLRSNLMYSHGVPISNAVVVTKDRMPQLYDYVAGICKDQNMRIPTIFITKDKPRQTLLGKFAKSLLGKFAKISETDSIKILISSGAILIDQDLLLETSTRAIEAAIACEIAHVKYNHDNKDVLIKLVAPIIVNRLITVDSPGKKTLYKLTVFLLPRALIAKRFEKQADRFVCETMNNAEGLIELCQYMQRKIEKNEADYAATRASLRESDIALIDYVFWRLFYAGVNIGHKLSNLSRWICHNTFLTSYQNNSARIKAAQQHLENQTSAAV